MTKRKSYGLEKTASFVIHKRDGYYEAVKGSYPDAGLVVFGGSENAGGVSGTDGRAVSQATINALKGDDAGYGRKRCNGRILIKDDITINDAVNLTSIESLEICGLGREATVKIRIQTSVDVVFDLVNSRHISFRNLHFQVDAGYAPKVIFLLARGDNNASVGDSTFEECYFRDEGGVIVAFHYNYGAELIDYERCIWRVKGRALYLNRNNPENIASSFATIATGNQSMSMTSYFQCKFYCDVATQEAIRIGEGACNHTWIKCYFGGGTYYAFLVEGTNYKTHVRDSHFEILGFTTLSSYASWKDIIGFEFIGNTINKAAGTYNFFDFDRANLVFNQSTLKDNVNLVSGVVLELHAYIIDHCNIDFRAEYYVCKVITTSYIRYSRIVAKDSNSITCGGGFVNTDIIYYSVRRVNQGLFVANGNGVQTEFSWEHGLAGAPEHASLTKKHNDIRGIDFSAAYTATYIYVYFASPPPSGTSNVVISWRAWKGLGVL